MKKWMLWILLLVLLVPVTAQGISHTLLERTIALTTYFESRGDYGCVTNDSNGKPSIGFYQWNGEYAVSLMKKIIAKDETGAQAILGDDLFASLRDGKNSVWNSRTLSATEIKAVRALLKSDAGRAVQDAQAESSATGYIEQAVKLGIKDATALCYYADIRHQVGSGAIIKYSTKAKEIAGSYEKITLETLYQAAMVYATPNRTRPRRIKGYEMLKADPVQDQNDSQDDQQADKPTALALSPAGTAVLKTNQTLSITPVLKPEGAQSRISWKSGNVRIATVKDGVVTPIAPGKTTILAKTDNGLIARLALTVKPVPVEKIALTGQSTMKKGETQTVQVMIAPSDATRQGVRWRSGNSKVCKVAQSGKVKAVGRGRTIIYCQAKDGSRTLAKFKVVVE